MFYDLACLDNAGRLLIVLSFLISGLTNLMQSRQHIARMVTFRVPFPALAFWFGTVLLFTGCALLLIGRHALFGAACLILFTVAATAIYHRFWTKTDAMERIHSRIALTGNTAILGGLLLLLQNLR